MDTITIYRAFDGKRFDSEKECKKYEDAFHDTMVQRFKQNFRRVDITEDICAYMINNLEADAYVFIGHDGWVAEVSAFTRKDSCEIYGQDNVSKEKRSLLIVSEWYVTAIDLETTAKQMKEDAGYLLRIASGEVEGEAF